MPKVNRQDIFIQYLSKIYEQNPAFPINKDTIYSELISFNYSEDKGLEKIPFSNLVSIQVGLNNHFKNDPNAHTFTNDYFWVIENRRGKKSQEFMRALSSGVKIYVPVAPEDMYYVSVNLFSYILSKNIIMQGKIDKDLRNDALVIRVKDPKDAIEVENYVNNSLHYKQKINANPFLLNRGKIALTIDGNSSYNKSVSYLLAAYLEEKRESNTLYTSSASDFGNFIEREINHFPQMDKDYLYSKYNIDTPTKYDDFIIIANILLKNIKMTLTAEELFIYQEELALLKNAPTKGLNKEPSRNALISIIASLSNLYPTQMIHKIIAKYLEEGNASYFTRSYNIRKLVQDNFTKESMLEAIKELGWSVFTKACQTTYDKYGYEQLTGAVSKFLEEGDLSCFTNEEDDRSRLALVISKELLKEVIIDKTHSKEPSLVSDIALESNTNKELKK